ncbi:MAG TPA: OstA-like protein [Chitinophagaceae bacterium]|nr:OstA-like protein [Chitinophagaceae bacterium]HPH33529.1 OstA-like protein [Chitinophagaceae bacterium]
MRSILLFFGILFTGTCLFPAMMNAQVKEPAATPINPQATSDSLRDIQILGSDRFTILKVDDSTTLQILAGHVRLKQGSSLFNCDSCVLNNGIRIFEAWGNVHIKDVDTVNITSSHLRYLIDKKIAYLDGGVKLTDGKGTLTTPDLEYDMNTEIGIYKNGGRVVNKKSVLTSQEGWYYAGLRDIYFKKNVVMKDPAYDIYTDSLLYNTQSQSTRFIAQTVIKDTSGRIIETSDGFYNMATGKAEFGKRPVIRDTKSRVYITGDQFAFNDSLQTSQALGNVVIIDSVQGTTILAGVVWQDKKNDRMLATNKPLMIIKQDNDSIYVTADTLFSARLSDLYARKDSMVKDTMKGVQVINLGKNKGANKGDSLTAPQPIAPATDSLSKKEDELVLIASRQDSLTKDSVVAPVIVAADQLPPVADSSKKGMPAVQLTPAASSDSLAKRTATDSLSLAKKDPNKKDSTDRYFEAYRNVRIFSDSMQAVSDSMFYSFKDSVFRLFQNPVLWSKGSQITGDTVLLFTKNKKADRVKVFENSFLVNESEPGIYNQVRSIRMDGWFKEGSLDSVRAAGYAECIYFIQDEDSAYTGINESKCDVMDIYFIEKELDKIVFRSGVTGTIWPMKDKSPSSMRLEKFQWLDNRRPKTKYELFE